MNEPTNGGRPYRTHEIEDPEYREASQRKYVLWIKSANNLRRPILKRGAYKVAGYGR